MNNWYLLQTKDNLISGWFRSVYFYLKSFSTRHFFSDETYHQNSYSKIINAKEHISMQYFSGNFKWNEIFRIHLNVVLYWRDLSVTNRPIFMKFWTMLKLNRCQVVMGPKFWILICIPRYSWLKVIVIGLWIKSTAVM